jgi:hypothetical protein
LVCLWSASHFPGSRFFVTGTLGCLRNSLFCSKRKSYSGSSSHISDFFMRVAAGSFHFLVSEDFPEKVCFSFILRLEVFPDNPQHLHTFFRPPLTNHEYFSQVLHFTFSSYKIGLSAEAVNHKLFCPFVLWRILFWHCDLVCGSNKRPRNLAAPQQSLKMGSVKPIGPLITFKVVVENLL